MATKLYFKVLHLRGGWQHETEIISSQTLLIFTSWHKGLQLCLLDFHIYLIMIWKNKWYHKNNSCCLRICCQNYLQRGSISFRNWWALQKLGLSSFKTGNEIRIQRAITRPSSFKLFTKIRFWANFIFSIVMRWSIADFGWRGPFRPKPIF